MIVDSHLLEYEERALRAGQRILRDQKGWAIIKAQPAPFDWLAMEYGEDHNVLHFVEGGLYMDCFHDDSLTPEKRWQYEQAALSWLRENETEDCRISFDTLQFAKIKGRQFASRLHTNIGGTDDSLL